ncbi:MAG: YbaB/EbfC family nucleoid-associated protein [Steroidobacteraceae bacterium]
MNGKHEVALVQIEPALLSEDREVVEDLVAAAINDATHKVGVVVNEKMSLGPAELELHELALLLAEDRVRELILATNSTVEGEATAHVVSEMARARGLTTTRIAQGVPFGGELEYVDGGTLAHALAGRQNVR